MERLLFEGMPDGFQSDLEEFLMKNLELRVESENQYTGGEPLYIRVHKVSLQLGGVEIDHIYLE